LPLNKAFSLDLFVQGVVGLFFAVRHLKIRFQAVQKERNILFQETSVSRVLSFVPLIAF